MKRTGYQLFTVLFLVLLAGSASAGSDRDDQSKRKNLHSGLATGMLTMVNQARAKARTCGDKEFPATAPLKWNDNLASAALKHAEDMAIRNYFSHKSKNGSTVAYRVKLEHYDYSLIGENIAFTKDMANVMNLWLSSRGHCANLMNADFTEMGAAFANGGSKAWETRWVQVFGRRR